MEMFKRLTLLDLAAPSRPSSQSIEKK